MPFEKGDFLLIDYVAKVKETGDVFDTTQEEVAKKERLSKEGDIYEPKLVVLGEQWVLKALDDCLSSLELGKPETIELPPEKGFGSRDPNKLRMVPLRKLRDKGITPRLGMRVEYENKLAVVRTIGAGRVQLDFNPPLAGKTLVYEVTAMKKLRTRKSKIAALIHRRIPVADILKFKLAIGKTEATIQIPEETFYIEGLQLAKRGIASDIRRLLPKIRRIEFIETFIDKGPEKGQEDHTEKEKEASKPKK